MVSHSTTLPCIPPSQRHPSSISVPTAWVRMQILFHVQNHEPAGISPLAPPALTVNVLVAYCMALVYMSVQKINLEKWEKKFKKDAVRKSFFFWQVPFFSNFHGFKVDQKAIAPHSSTLTWKIPWMEEPVRLQSMGSLGVGHDWATSLSLFTFMHWRRK